MHALVGVKAACRRTVAGINAHESIRIGQLDGVPAFLGNIDGVGCSRIQDDAASVLVCDLRIIGPRNQGQLVPGPYSGRQFIEKAVGPFGVIDVPDILPDAFPSQQSVVGSLVHHHHVLFSGHGLSVLLQGNGNIGRPHGSTAAQARTDGFHRR